jgi:hypothetical protein
MQPNTVLRLTAVKLTVTSDIEEHLKDLSNPDNVRRVSLTNTRPHSSLILEDCVFESAFDSPMLSQLMAFRVSSGVQVGLQELQLWHAPGMRWCSSGLLFLPPVAHSH